MFVWYGLYRKTGNLLSVRSVPPKMCDTACTRDKKRSPRRSTRQHSSHLGITEALSQIFSHVGGAEYGLRGNRRRSPCRSTLYHHRRQRSTSTQDQLPTVSREAKHREAVSVAGTRHPPTTITCPRRPEQRRANNAHTCRVRTTMTVLGRAEPVCADPHKSTTSGGTTCYTGGDRRGTGRSPRANSRARGVAEQGDICRNTPSRTRCGGKRRIPQPALRDIPLYGERLW